MQNYDAAQNKLPVLITLAWVLLTHLSANAWGERGHHIAGYTAAKITNQLLTKSEVAIFGSFFEIRAFQMGHLNNIPDISWKQAHQKVIHHRNWATHFFDAEFLVGYASETAVSNSTKKKVPLTSPPKVDESYKDKIRNLETDIDKYISLYHNQPNIFSDPQVPKVHIFNNVGIAPFRVAQLYNLMVAAFRCSADKKSAASVTSPGHPNEMLTSATAGGEFNCAKIQSREEALYVAIAIGGVMGHFVADLAQPFHTTIDYDGYAFGQGGIHTYFETEILNQQDETITSDAMALLNNKDFRKSNFEKLNSMPFNPTKIMFHLVADSQGHLKKIYDLDKKYASITEGTKISFGHKRPKEAKGAIRRPADSPRLANKFRAVLVERLAVGSLLLSHLWVQAWREAGSPKLQDISFIAIPYVLDVPFILPDKKWPIENSN